MKPITMTIPPLTSHWLQVQPQDKGVFSHELDINTHALFTNKMLFKNFCSCPLTDTYLNTTWITTLVYFLNIFCFTTTQKRFGAI